MPYVAPTKEQQEEYSALWYDYVAAEYMVYLCELRDSGEHDIPDINYRINVIHYMLNN